MFPTINDSAEKFAVTGVQKAEDKPEKYGQVRTSSKSEKESEQSNKYGQSFNTAQNDSNFNSFNNNSERMVKRPPEKFVEHSIRQNIFDNGIESVIFPKTDY
jgi:hypothetical protein